MLLAKDDGLEEICALFLQFTDHIIQYHVEAWLHLNIVLNVLLGVPLSLDLALTAAPNSQQGLSCCCGNIVHSVR